MPEDILFDLKSFGEKGVQLAQLAASTEPAGQIETVQGTVSVRRLSGETENLAVGDEVFMGDTLEVSENGNVGVLFVDDTTLALGSGGQLVIDELVFDPSGDSGSMALNIANGVFSFVSGQISKTADEAMIINTPVATIGIRGTKGAGVAAQEGQENRVTLMPEDDGQVGEMVVRNEAGLQVLNQPGQTLSFSSRFDPPPPPSLMSESEMQSAYGSALNVMPPQPRRTPSGERARSEEGGGNGPSGEANPQAEQANFQEGGEDTAEAEAGLFSGEIPGPLEEGGELEEPPILDVEPTETEPEGEDVGLKAKDVGVIGFAQVTDSGFEGEGLNFEDFGLDDPNSLLGSEDPLLGEEPLEEVTDTPLDVVIDETTNTVNVNLIEGTTAAEQRFGTSANETISMSDGDDWAMGDAGADHLIGGSGNDVLYGDSPIIGRLTTDDNGLEISSYFTFANANGELESTSSSTWITIFQTSGSPLVAEDTNGASDVYIRKNGVLELVSAAADGTVGNATSDGGILTSDGAYAFFNSYATNLDGTSSGTNWQVYRKNLNTGAVEKVSTLSDNATELNGFSYFEAVSDDGNLVVFRTDAANVATDVGVTDSNSAQDLYLKNISTGALQLVSKNVTGATGNSGSYNADISGDGTLIVFESTASDFYDTNSDNISDDTSGTVSDIFVYDVTSGEITELISRATGTAGAQGDAGSYNPYISSDGQFVVFESDAQNLGGTDSGVGRDIYLRDRVNDTTVKITSDFLSGEATGHSYHPSVSDDGAYVVYHSSSTDLTSGTDANGTTTDIYITEVATGETRRLNIALGGTQDGTIGAYSPRISEDGHKIFFHSFSSTLVPADGNGTTDLFAVANPFTIDPSGGVDTLEGGIGDDTLWGGVGDDVLYGGDGADVFYFKVNDGTDTIKDFTSGLDKIALDFELVASSGSTIDFEYVSGTYDGTNASTNTVNVVQDDTGQLYVDTNGQTAGGYTVVANVEGDQVVQSDLQIHE